ncbi:hypothetical protein [Leptolyngbya sp. FACHB-17]|uniref:hypothetical protein n=1 Tax=unclassified Leptolyngbya TaxID=2650499 RepID=UPI0016814743|nr:hypothetical protein [Leptolyngbya sp. FACHB-17]MBD2083366.1 hypothetical protein [Leptolyngbya sp. FACHB-17]
MEIYFRLKLNRACLSVLLSAFLALLSGAHTGKPPHNVEGDCQKPAIADVQKAGGLTNLPQTDTTVQQ